MKIYVPTWKIILPIQYEQAPSNFPDEKEYEDVFKDQKLEKPEEHKNPNYAPDLETKANLAAKQFPNELKKQKPKDKKCLLNFYPGTKIPRNTRCSSTGLKYKNCCGRLN